MSDFEEADFFHEPWHLPPKRKRKKDPKDKKRKSGVTVKTPESVQKKKKKKNSKCKEAMQKAKKEGKKKEKQKRRLSVKLGDSVMFRQCSSAQVSHPHHTEKLKPHRLTPESMKKRKRKPKVAFDATPPIRVKRPKFASSSPKEKEAPRDAESCSGAAVAGRGQDRDSQSTADDINSQDLFITQKTFRPPLSEPSSSEASDRALTSSPRLLPQQFREESDKCPQDPQSRLLSGQPKTEEAEEDRELREHVRPSVGNPFLDEAIIISSSPDVAKENICTPSRRSPSGFPHADKSSFPLLSTVSSSTQTENFFTTELSSYLSFCRKSRQTVRFEDPKPLDLSLPQRARKNLGSCLSVAEVKHDEDKQADKGTSLLPREVKGEGGGGPSGPPHVKEKRAPPGRGETTPSPQLSGSDHKSADTTTSSEDNEQPNRAGKRDLIQVRAVQMRLNESFFFKTKGEGQSPRPESPLMKLAQGRGIKSRKGH